jgi:hypothetical protein
MTPARLEIKNASKQPASMILLDTDHISVLQWEGEAAERLRRRMAESTDDWLGIIDRKRARSVFWMPSDERCPMRDIDRLIAYLQTVVDSVPKNLCPKR